MHTTDRTGPEAMTARSRSAWRLESSNGPNIETTAGDGGTVLLQHRYQTERTETTSRSNRHKHNHALGCPRPILTRPCPGKRRSYFRVQKFNIAWGVRRSSLPYLQ